MGYTTNIKQRHGPGLGRLISSLVIHSITCCIIPNKCQQQANMNFPSNQLIQLHCNVENFVIYFLHLTHFNTTCIMKFMKHSSPQGSTASSEIIHVDHWQPHILRKRCLAPRPLEVKTASHRPVFVGFLSCMEDTIHFFARILDGVGV